MPIDLENAIPIGNAAELDGWLAQHGDSQREVVVAIYNKAPGRQGVSLAELQEVEPRLGRHADPAHRHRAIRDSIRPAPTRLALVAQEPCDGPPDAGRGADHGRRDGGLALGPMNPAADGVLVSPTSGRR